MLREEAAETFDLVADPGCTERMPERCEIAGDDRFSQLGLYLLYFLNPGHIRAADEDRLSFVIIQVTTETMHRLWWNTANATSLFLRHTEFKSVHGDDFKSCVFKEFDFRLVDETDVWRAESNALHA